LGFKQTFRQRPPTGFLTLIFQTEYRGLSRFDFPKRAFGVGAGGLFSGKILQEEGQLILDFTRLKGFHRPKNRVLTIVIFRK